jgi:indole-3-glycerol phosphate synthase
VSILDDIVAWKRMELAEAQARVPLAALKAKAADQPPARDFAGALRDPAGRPRLIAEVKKASPSAGLLRADLDPVVFGRTYAYNGAAAISVLTDSKFFQGSLEHLTAIREALDADLVLSGRRPPLLRKDFLFDSYQVYEARAAGADTLLFIVSVVQGRELGDLIGLARSLGMEALVEVHDEEEAGIALEQDAQVIGVNNRDLRTFTTDIETTRRLRSSIPQDRTVVSESGIRGRDDLSRLQSWGVQAVLIGEAIVTAPDVAAKVREFAGTAGVE